jgi:hypothetical protein
MKKLLSLTLALLATTITPALAEVHQIMEAPFINEHGHLLLRKWFVELESVVRHEDSAEYLLHTTTSYRGLITDHTVSMERVTCSYPKTVQRLWGVTYFYNIRGQIRDTQHQTEPQPAKVIPPNTVDIVPANVFCRMDPE